MIEAALNSGFRRKPEWRVGGLRRNGGLVLLMSGVQQIQMDAAPASGD